MEGDRLYDEEGSDETMLACDCKPCLTRSRLFSGSTCTKGIERRLRLDGVGERASASGDGGSLGDLALGGVRAFEGNELVEWGAGRIVVRSGAGA